jgi:hypothetical protein
LGSIFLTDFKYGLDRRRERVAGLPGTLWVARNVQITRGGDIERPKRFVPTYTLPAGQTFGMGSVGGQLYVFGSVSNPGVPTGVQYQQLSAPSGAAMTQVLDVRAAGGKLYVIARYADGNLFHFYDGARVTDWDAVADANFTYSTLATYMASLVSADATVSAVAVGTSITFTALAAGTAFTLSKSTTDNGGLSDQDITLSTLVANVPAVAEVKATSAIVVASGSTGVISDITAHGTSLMRAAVPWTTNAATTAAAIGVQINDKTATHGYTATVVSATITLTAPPGLGATANEYVVAATTTGDIVLNTPTMGGGVTAVAAVAQVSQATFIGTPQSTDQFIITINSTSYVANGRASCTGTSLYVNKRRMWSPAHSLWEYCKLNTFSNWSDAGASAGAGFLNVSNDAEGSEPLVGAGAYMTLSAVFSRRNCRIYSISADATQLALSQPLDNTGSLAARAILNYGTVDLFYLDETGIRSLRQRDASGAAFVNDIGTAIDTFVRANMDALSFGTIQRACAVVEPRDGRFWMAIGPYIYVLSYFPGSNVNAWTYLDPGFTVSDFARIYNQLYVRSGDTIYLYGGANGSTFPNANEMIAQVDLPFVSTSPPTMIVLDGIDSAMTNAWQTYILVDPDDTTQQINAGILTGVSYDTPDNAAPGRSTHFAMSMTCSAAGQATISNIALRYSGGEPNV